MIEHNLETNPKMIKAIKRMHAVMETPDIEKQRAAQENFGGILSKSRELTYQNFELGGIPAEWSCVERSHMKKYVILYCHGGGYTSGSSGV